MAIDTTTLRSRRAIIGGALGGLAAVAASALGRPLAARATDGDVLHIGDFSGMDNTQRTEIHSSADFTFVGQSTDPGGVGLFGVGNAGGVQAWAYGGSGVTGVSQPVYPGTLQNPVPKTGVYGVADLDATARGVLGKSTIGVGVQGEAVEDVANHPGVWGAGVLGLSGPAGGAASHSKTGVMGFAAQDASARGVTGQSTAGRGVNGIATSGTGVYGAGTTGEGVHGDSTSSNGVAGSSASNIATGVYGENTAGGYGTYGRSNVTGGFGIYGEALLGTGATGFTDTGIGVQATAGPGGTALKAQGRVKFSTSGLTSVTVGAKSKVITPGTDLVATSLVLCTLESNQLGLFIQRVVKNTTANTFTVFLANAVATGKTAKVAWFVIG